MGEPETPEPATDLLDGSPGATAHLVARARAGDERALEALFERYHKPLGRWAAGRLPPWARDVADTQDLVQETLINAFRNIEGFDPRGPGALYAYLRQALMNRIKNELRRVGRRGRSAELDPELADAAPSPLEQAIGRQATQRYELALQRLRPADREALVARIELGCSYEELATALGKPSSEAARKAARRALFRLAEEMTRAD
jgi:RNA polymerase sigma-70 factor (ECF subfamily)